MSFASRYSQFVIRRPLVVLALAAAVLVPMLWLATKLDLRTDFKDLLPQNKRSVIELDRIGQRIGGNASFSIGIEGDDLPAMKRFADALADRLRALPPGIIYHLDYTVKEEREFFMKNRWLYANYADLEEIRDALEARVIKETPFDLGLDDEEPAPAKGSTQNAQAKPAEKPADKPKDLKALQEKLKGKVSELDRFPDGYYTGENGHLLAMFVFVPGGTDFDKARPILDRVRAEITQLNPTAFHPSIKATITGDLYVGIREYDALREDILLVSVICTVLVLIVIVVFFGRLRSLGILGVTSLVGVGITFGIARLTIGYLNSSTAFLASIIIGNGSNFGVIMLARFFEERRGGKSAADSLDIAIRHTAAGTAGAAAAAGVAYGSLMLTDFRGFNQFGVIGGIGMVICWLAAYTVGPALVALCERFPIMAKRTAKPWPDFFARPFSYCVRKFPRGVVVFATVISTCGLVFAARFLMSDPLEYDFGKLGNQARNHDYAWVLGGRIGQNIRGEGRDGVLILADRAEQVPLIKKALEEHKAATEKRGERSAVGAAYTAGSLLPDQQPEKIKLLEHIRNVLEKVKDNLDDEDRKVALEHQPPADLRVLTLADLPKKVLEPFMERDGTVDRVVYVAPAKWVRLWNGEDLMKYASAVEKLTLDNGETIYTSGNAVVFADMIRNVRVDGPRAVYFSFAGVLLMVVIIMRKFRPTLLTVIAIICGSGTMIGLAGVLGMKLNFLNFVAIPIALGVGADYAINMVRRHLDEPHLAPYEMVERTGGPVILCSLTTIIGYSSLYIASNRALVSFGVLAGMGEVTSLFTGVAFFPALVKLLGATQPPKPMSKTTNGTPSQPHIPKLSDDEEISRPNA